MKVLGNVNLKELKELNLIGLEISDIKILENVKFDKLEILDLSDNQISKKENESIISKMKTIIKEFYI